MAKAPKKPRKKAANGYKMPEPLPQGEVFTDITKNTWKLGPFIGKGGFGDIYSAQEGSSRASKKFPYVIKVEPHENGPLFVEMHFYMKNAKVDDIEAFKKRHKLKTFGMPAYLGSGSHEVGPNKYRFIVMERFGTDIEKVRHENGGSFPVPVVFQLAWQMTYILEYIHQCEYVHADLKGANILMGIGEDNKNQAYLVDFGLATKYSKTKEFKPNPKKAHDGTIEYLSRDAHHGVPTRRGDLEVLGYNLIHWLGGKLPWDSHLNDAKAVQQVKEQAMEDIPKFVKACLGSTKTKSIDTVVQFLKWVNGLKFDEEPEYNKIRNLFKKEVEAAGAKVDGPLDFKLRKKRRSEEEGDAPDKKPKEETPKKGRGGRKKAEDVEDQEEEVKVPKKGRKARKKDENEEKSDAEEAAEKMSKVVRRKKAAKAEDNLNVNKKTQNGVAEEVDFAGYTDAMKEVKLKKMNREKANGVVGERASARLRNRK